MSDHGGLPSAGGIHPAAVGGKVRRPRIRRKRKPVEGAQVVKHQVEVTTDGAPAVVNAKAGPLTIFDKMKAYYHTIFTVLAAILVLLNQLLPVVHMIPGYGEQAAGYVSVAIIAVTAVVNFLKSNEVWVEKL